MAKDIIRTDDAPHAHLYSQAVRAAGLVFVSGQSGQDPVTGQLAGPTVEAQTRQCLKNIKAIVEAAGSSMDKVVTATFILRNPEDFDQMNTEWSRWFPDNPPARQGASLPINVEGLLVSISAIAEQ